MGKDKKGLNSSKEEIDFIERDKNYYRIRSFPGLSVNLFLIIFVFRIKLPYSGIQVFKYNIVIFATMS